MTPQPSFSTPPPVAPSLGGPSTPRWPLLALAVIVIATLPRLLINFSLALPPGMDAGYYPLQIRTWLERGTLAFSDVPLYFWLGAALTRILTALGVELDPATLWASRLLDSLLPPLAAIFTVLIAARTASDAPIAERPRARAIAISAFAAAALPLLTFPALRAVSDFQKQSFALVFMAMGLWAVHQLSRGFWPWCVAALAVPLAGLTHAGTGAATALIVGLGVLAHVLITKRPSPRGLIAAATLMLVAAVLTAGAAYWASPTKARAIFTGLAKVIDFSALRGPGLNSGLIITVIVYAGGLWMLRAVWLDRARVHKPDAALIVAATLAAMALACPILDNDYARRLALMAPTPFAMALAVTLVRRVIRAPFDQPPPTRLARLLAAVAILSAFAAIPASRAERLSPTDIAELRELRAKLDTGARTIVVANHGTEFWLSYYWHLPARQWPPDPDTLAKFDRVLYVTELRTRRGPPGGPGGPAGPGNQRGGPPGRTPLQPPPDAEVVYQTAAFKISERFNTKP